MSAADVAAWLAGDMTGWDSLLCIAALLTIIYLLDRLTGG